MKYELVLWDFDGTLADTLTSGVEIYNELAARHGFVAIADPPAVRDMTTGEFLKHHGIAMYRVPLLVREFLAAQRENIEAVRIFPELIPILGGMQKAGCRLAVVSTNSSENIETCLRASDAKQYFEFVEGYSYLFGKQRAIRRALRRAAVNAARALYVGDEVRDIEAARRVGVDVAAVTWGFNSERLLQQHKPTYLASTADELRSVLARTQP